MVSRRLTERPLRVACVRRGGHHRHVNNALGHEILDRGCELLYRRIICRARQVVSPPSRFIRGYMTGLLKLVPVSKWV